MVNSQLNILLFNFYKGNDLFLIPSFLLNVIGYYKIGICKDKRRTNDPVEMTGNGRDKTKKVQELQKKLTRKFNYICLIVGNSSGTKFTPLQIRNSIGNRKKEQGHTTDKAPNMDVHVKLRPARAHHYRTTVLAASGWQVNSLFM